MNMLTKYRRYELKLHGIANYGYSFNKKKCLYAIVHFRSKHLFC